MEKRHGGTLLLQALEPKKLIGSMMSVVTETGEDWIHVVFLNESGMFELRDDGQEMRLLLSRTVALSLLALLRIALAQFALLHGHGESAESPRIQAEASTRTQRVEVRVEASRHSMSVSWPSAAEGVRRQEVNGQVELRLGAVLGDNIEQALLASLARVAAGVVASTS